MKRTTPVVHLDTTVGVNFLSILEPSYLRRWYSFSLTHKAGGAGTWPGKTLWPLNQGRWCFRRTTSMRYYYMIFFFISLYYIYDHQYNIQTYTAKLMYILTQHSDIGWSNGIVACAGSGGSAHVNSSMLRLDICDNEVTISQHFGVVNVNRLAVSSAPGDDGSGIACGHALQNSILVQRHRNVLWPGNDAWPLGKLGAGGCREGEEPALVYSSVMWCKP